MLISNMNGIVLCAGLGSRLRPLTSAIPKPAVPVGPVPAALRNIEQLLSAGFPVIHCNTHYLATELENELRSACRSAGISPDKIRFWNEPELLETGGGIARIVRALAAETNQQKIPDTLVVSGDIVADIPVADMMTAWSSRSTNHSALMVTLPLDKPRKDVTWVDEARGRVRGFGADFDPAHASSLQYTPRIFSNHQILSGDVLHRQPIEKKSSIDLFYRSALRLGEEIIHVPLPHEKHWFDIGTPESYLGCISMLDQRLPACLTDQSLKMINLCVPVHEKQAVNNAECQDKNNLDESCSREPNVEQFCISKTVQNGHWTWLGMIHCLPNSLSVCLSGLIDSLNGGDGFVLPSVGSDRVAFQLRPLSDSFLLDSFARTAAQTRPSVGHTQGLLTALIPPRHRSSPLLQTPLLVSLDLLLGSGALPALASSQTHSPFWILFIPQRQ